MNEWQPIETAPKDGRWLFFSNGERVQCGYYDYGSAYPWREKGGNAWMKDWPKYWYPMPPPPFTPIPKPPEPINPVA
jgi:hypothetical protein